uniref:Peptidase M12B propeptide domain-containing protein n=1 Tax=Hucho hucho TaxID=62062 RepID=A0A4W5LC43_9TELE
MELFTACQVCLHPRSQLSEVVHPYRVDAKGHFLSNFLSHRVSRVQRRETPGEPGNPARVFYQLQHGGHNLHFNLTLNPHLLAPGFLTEKRYGGLEGAKIRSHGPSLCHFIGDVWDRATMKGRAAISTCDGLVSVSWMSSMTCGCAKHHCASMNRSSVCVKCLCMINLHLIVLSIH